MKKALGLFSGGLDSILAAKLIQEQGVKVELINFYTPFFPPKNAIKISKQLKLKLKKIDITKDYIKMLRNPKHGYGSEMNPCIDCKILMLKEAKKYAKKINAKFIFTGEVLGERPMSQNKKALKLIEMENGLKRKLLRPLSSKLLPITEAEKKWVNRSRLLNIIGRRRDKQMKLAKKFKIKKYPYPSGGCLLTYKEYAKKIRDLLKNKKRVTRRDLELLKLGRHFRFKNNKIIVGRNKEENKKLLELKQKTDYIFEVPNIGSPTTILQGPKTKKAIEIAAQLTARYSDAKRKTKVKYGRKLKRKLIVISIKEREIKKLRI
ncbi:MAG: tRNA 4-thiouridine(8) synthase ThiI [Candidatus Aenigmarchaeota archaeon]|nr:tRNA 4-thiouridine(8) synthase ThiI [Candidatus Aenigmarchaeota archaeon]